MGKDSLRRGWNWLLRWVLWWRIDQEDVRREVEGYATINPFFTARGFGFLVSMLLGMPKLILGVIMVVTTPQLLWMLFIGELGSPLVSCPLAEGLVFLILGYLLFQGKKPAIPAMMLWWSTYIVLLNIRCYYNAAPILERSIFLCVSLLGWTSFMHVLLTALRVERARTPAA